MTNYDIQYNIECYRNNTEIETVDLGGYPWKDNSMSYGFYQCENLHTVANINENITNMWGTFANCYNLVVSPVLPNNVENMHVTFGGCNKLSTMPNLPNSVVDMAGSFQLCSNIIDSTIIPNSVVDMSDTFYGCSNLVNISVIPNNVELMTGTFHGCTNITDEVIINSAIVENANKCFYLTNAIKNVFIPFWNQEDEHSVSFNSFNVVAGYPTEEPRVNGVLLYDINDWYLFDWRFRTEQNGVRRLYEYLNKTNPNVIVPKYKTILNDYNYNDPTNTPFFSQDQFESVDLNFVPWVNNSMGMYRNGAFTECGRLRSVSNINENVYSLYWTFGYCYNLVNAPVIPNSVREMSYTFRYCTNLVNAPVLPNGITTLYETFFGCMSLDVNTVTIPNSVIYLTRTFGDCRGLTDAPLIPNSVTSMEATFTSCTNLVNAPIIPNNVTDINQIFTSCTNLVNAPIIPNNVTNMYGAFRLCNKLTEAPEIPNSVIDIAAAFMGCTNFVNAPIIPNNVTELTKEYSWDTWALFKDCTNLRGNIYILSENIISANQCFYGTSLEKDVYIHFKNNGVYTSTYNAFITAGYSETERVHGALLIDIDDEGIDLSDYEYTNVSNDITLEKYIGVGKTSIITPHLS